MGEESFENADAASRSTDRFEIKFPLREPFTNANFVGNDLVVYLSLLFMSDRVEMDTFSFVTSLAGAPDQHWHADVSHLHPRRGNLGHIPPPGIVVVVPLDDMNVETGPTEHMFGSHIKVKGIDWANPPDDART